MGLYQWPFRHHGGFQQTANTPGVRPTDIVLASISEINEQGVPFQGLATLQVQNVVPGTDVTTIRGEIGWDSDVLVQLSIFKP